MGLLDGNFDNLNYENIMNALMVLNARPGELNDRLTNALQQRQMLKKKREEEAKALQQKQMRQQAMGLLDRSFTVPGDATMPARDPNVPPGLLREPSDIERGRKISSLGIGLEDPSLMSLGKSLLSDSEPKRSDYAKTSGYAINPETRKPDFFTTDDTGKKLWLGTEGRPQEDAYSQIVELNGNAYIFDTRAKTLEPIKLDGKQAVKPPSDIGLQQKLSEAKTQGKEIGKQQGTIESGIAALESLGAATTVLDKGIYSGFWGPAQMAVMKATPGVDKSKASRTEQYISHIGNTVLPRLQEFGGSDTVGEMNYLKDIQAGKIDLEESTMRAVIKSAEEKIRRRLERLRQGGPADQYGATGVWAPRVNDYDSMSPDELLKNRPGTR